MYDEEAWGAVGVLVLIPKALRSGLRAGHLSYPLTIIHRSTEGATAFKDILYNCTFSTLWQKCDEGTHTGVMESPQTLGHIIHLQ